MNISTKMWEKQEELSSEFEEIACITLFKLQNIISNLMSCELKTSITKLNGGLRSTQT